MRYTQLIENFSIVQQQLEQKEVTSIQALDKTYASILAFVFGNQIMEEEVAPYAAKMLEDILEVTDKSIEMAHIRMRIKSYATGLKQGRSLTMEELLSD